MKTAQDTGLPGPVKHGPVRATHGTRTAAELGCRTGVDVCRALGFASDGGEGCGPGRPHSRSTGRVGSPPQSTEGVALVRSHRCAGAPGNERVSGACRRSPVEQAEAMAAGGASGPNRCGNPGIGPIGPVLDLSFSS